MYIHTSQVTAQGQDLKFLCRGLSCIFVFCQLVCGLGLVAAYSCVQIRSCTRHALQVMHGFSFTFTVAWVSSIDPAILFFEAWRSKKRLTHPCCGKHVCSSAFRSQCASPNHSLAYKNFYLFSLPGIQIPERHRLITPSDNLKVISWKRASQQTLYQVPLWFFASQSVKCPWLEPKYSY